jgi:hypothetical protein
VLNDALLVPDIEERGLRLGFHALTPRERDVFVVYDLQLYYEMEGCFADHIPNATEEFDWLEDTLMRIGDLGSLRIIRELRKVEADGSAQAFALCDMYDQAKEWRWECLERYLIGQGAQLRWSSGDA